jgi:hypothetical protein
LGTLSGVEVRHQGPDELADLFVAHVVVTTDEIPCVDQENLSRCGIELEPGGRNIGWLVRRESRAFVCTRPLERLGVADHDVEDPAKTQGVGVGTRVGKDRAEGPVIDERCARETELVND